MAKKSKEELEYHALLENIRNLIKLRQGREFIWYVLSICDLYSDVFTGNSRTFYQEGKRAVGLEILALLEDADSTIYPRMLLNKAKEKENG